MAGGGPQGSPTVLQPIVPQPSASSPGFRPPGDSSWLDANLPNEPQFLTNSSASMASNLVSGNEAVVAEGAGPSTPPNRGALNTSTFLNSISPNTKTQQGSPSINKPGGVVYAGLDPAAISWVKTS